MTDLHELQNKQHNQNKTEPVDYEKFYKTNYPNRFEPRKEAKPTLIRSRIETLQSSPQKFDTSQNHVPKIAWN